MNWNANLAQMFLGFKHAVPIWYRKISAIAINHKKSKATFLLKTIAVFRTTKLEPESILALACLSLHPRLHQIFPHPNVLPPYHISPLEIISSACKST
jgi:hypothetical protein